MDMQEAWYKKKPEHTIWWLNNLDTYGNVIFSFDLETRYEMFRDYPYNLTPEQKKIFDEENPRWKEFFSYRQ